MSYLYSTSITTRFVKLLRDSITALDLAVPVTKIRSVSCFHAWLNSCYLFNVDTRAYVECDYYNGSGNDLVNIFREINNLAIEKHCFNGNYVLERMKFLADEGLNIVDVNSIKVGSFKVTPEEANKVIMGLVNKTKKPSKATVKKNLKKAVQDYKKKVKSSVGLKPLKRKSVKRDMKGRFTKNK